MKLIEMRCKNCGAMLNVEENSVDIVCNYCGAKFKLDDEVQHVKYDDMEQAGYEFEMGKIRARQEHNNQQFQAFYNNASDCIEMSPIADFIITFFLGMFGVHKFLKRQISMGVLYFFTAGLFGIGWFYDTVMAVIRLVKSKGSQ